MSTQFSLAVGARRIVDLCGCRMQDANYSILHVIIMYTCDRYNITILSSPKTPHPSFCYLFLDLSALLNMDQIWITFTNMKPWRAASKWKTSQMMREMQTFFVGSVPMIQTSPHVVATPP